MILNLLEAIVLLGKNSLIFTTCFFVDILKGVMDAIKPLHYSQGQEAPSPLAAGLLVAIFPILYLNITSWF